MGADENAVPPKRTLEGVVANFVAGLDARLTAIENAFITSDWEELRMLSHKLAGAALFGYPELGQVAHTLEKAAKTEDAEKIRKHIAALKEQCVQIVKQTSF